MATDASFKVDIDTHILEQIIRNTPGQIKAFLDAEAEVMVNDIVLSFGVSPAPPNNPPGVDIGNLRASITWEPDGANRRVIMDGPPTMITTGAAYGVYLELGSTRHNYVWPFMGPAFERENRVFGRHAIEAGLVKP